MNNRSMERNRNENVDNRYIKEPKFTVVSPHLKMTESTWQKIVLEQVPRRTKQE